MKTVGIIGGFGPETTSKFYLAVVEGCQAVDRSARPPILMWSAPVQLQIEEDLIKRATGEERYVPYLLDAVKRLERGGADFLVLPCNSLHVFIDEIRGSVRIPVLSIVEESAAFLAGKMVSKCGLLATKSTVERKLYQKPLEKRGISVSIPDSKDQAALGDVINRLVLSDYGAKERAELNRIIEAFEKRGIPTVLLACTDLQLVIPKTEEERVIDSMQVLVKATVRKIFS